MAYKKKSKNGFDGDKFKFEEAGQVLEGYFLEMTGITIKGKPATRAVFKTATGNVSVLASSNLVEGLSEDDIILGAMTKVTYEGAFKTQSGNTFKKFTVEQDDDIVLEEGARAAATATKPSTSPVQSSHANSVAKAAASLKGGQLGKTVA